MTLALALAVFLLSVILAGSAAWYTFRRIIRVMRPLLIVCSECDTGFVLTKPHGSDG